MKSKRLSLMAALALGGLLACSTMAYAQDANANKGGRRGGMMGTPQQRVERLNSELTLTADQKTKLTAFFEEQSKKMQDIRNLPQEERRTKFQAMREEETKKMKEVLTPEQFQKWEKAMQQRRQGGKKKAE